MVNIAIDGPSGAGKSTLAKNVAKALGYIYVDTGALYRAVGLSALRKELDTKNHADVAANLDGVAVEIKYIGGEQRVFLNGNDVTGEIRRPEASMAASDVSAVPEVRKFLFNIQKNIANENNCVMDGRDIGTVVLPGADVKIFLSTSAEERAKRRHEELLAKVSDVKYDDVLEDIKKRDNNDSTRAAAPLKRADDAIDFDNTGLEAHETLAGVLDIINGKLRVES